MAEGGYALVYRRVLEDEDFRSPAEALAFVYLILKAAWKPVVVTYKRHAFDLDRGQLTISLRDMAADLEWSKSRADRFIALLERVGKIAISSPKMRDSRETLPGTPVAQSVGHLPPVITICKYDEYQSPSNKGETPQGSTLGQQRDTTRDTEQINNKNKEKKEGGGAAEAATREYAFAGRTIRLNRRDFDTWRQTYHAIPDIAAELMSLDAWFEGQPEAKRRGWFHTTSGALNRKHQEILRANADRGEAWASPC